MRKINRREFISAAGKIAAAMGLSSAAIPKIAKAMQELSSGRAPVVWLQGQSCSGCSISFLNSVAPSPVSVLTEYVSLLFHPTVSTATGHKAVDIIDAARQRGGMLLVVEGSLPTEMPEAWHDEPPATE